MPLPLPTDRSVAETMVVDERDGLRDYFYAIAEAHRVLRKVLRIVDEQATRAGLDPLEHKLLIQLFGAHGGPLRVSEAARRVDIPPALASRLLKRLEARGLVVRSHSDADRRITQVKATDLAREFLTTVDREVRRQLDYLQPQISDDERSAAMRIFGLYLGAPVEG